MKIVIELPNCIKNDLDKAQNDRDAVALVVQCSIPIAKAIINGTSLPKGYGRLGDLDALEKRFLEMAEDPWNIGVGVSSTIEDMADLISDAPTIIEADKGEEE